MLKVYLAGLDTRKVPTTMTDEAVAAVKAFVQAQAANNPDVIAGLIFDTIENWKSFSLQDLASVRDAAENILFIGKKLSAEEQDSFRARAQGIADGINAATRKPRRGTHSKSMVAEAGRLPP